MRGQKHPTVYMLASQKNGTLYIGVTSDLEGRIAQHKLKLVPGFTSTYDVCGLVWYEAFDDMMSAIAREMQLKRWNRAWKIRLIEEHNPCWEDLSADWFGLS